MIRAGMSDTDGQFMPASAILFFGGALLAFVGIGMWGWFLVQEDKEEELDGQGGATSDETLLRSDQ